MPPPPSCHLSALALGLTLVASSANAATTVTLRPNSASSGTTNGDAFVTTGPTGNLSGNNYGGGGALAISAPGSATGEFASYLRFDAASAKSTFDAAYGAGAWMVDTVVLQLTTSTPNNAIFNSNMAGAFSVQWIPLDNWIEGNGTPATPSATGVKWTDAPALTAGAEAQGMFTIASVADGATANYTLSLSSGLRNDIAGGGSVSLYLGAADLTMSAVLNSRSFGTASRNPAFIVTASPIPEPRGGLLLLGCVVSCFRRRR